MRTERRARAGTVESYIARVNRSIDHAMANLAAPLRLSALADAAHLSPFHFHRVFQAMTGETPADFVKRHRLARALGMLARRPRPPLTRVALDCGFSTPSDFTRSFRQRFGSAPSAFDLEAWRAAHRAELEELVRRASGATHVTALPPEANPDGFRVTLRELPARRVAYVRVRDPYRGDGVLRAAQKLLAWAEREGVADRPWLGFQWDNPEVVPLAQCRYHVGVEADRVVAKGAIGRYDFAPMTVAQVEIRGGIDLELRALYWLYGAWLPRSGLVPDDAPCFEAWVGRPFAHGTDRCELDIQLPVRKGLTAPPCDIPRSTCSPKRRECGAFISGARPARGP